MRKVPIRQITYGSMLIAMVSIVLAIDTISAGFLLSIMPFFLPVPFAIYSRDFGFYAGLIVLFSISLVGLFFAPFYQVIFAVAYGFMGVIYGAGLKRGFNDKQLMIMTFFGVLIVTLFTAILFASLFGYDLVSEIISISNFVSSVVSVPFQENMVIAVFMLTLVLQSLLEAYVIHMLSTLLFLYLKMKPARRLKWTQIKVSPWVGLLSGAVFLLMFAQQKYNFLPDYSLAFSFVGMIGYFVLVSLGVLFFYKDPRFNKYSLYSIILLIFTAPFFTPVHIGIGLFTSVAGYWR